MATPDSGDSNLPKEPGNEVCDITNCVAIKGARGNALIPSEREVPSTGFKETEVTFKKLSKKLSGLFTF